MNFHDAQRMLHAENSINKKSADNSPKCSNCQHEIDLVEGFQGKKELALHKGNTIKCQAKGCVCLMPDTAMSNQKLGAVSPYSAPSSIPLGD